MKSNIKYRETYRYGKNVSHIRANFCLLLELVFDISRNYPRQRNTKFALIVGFFGQAVFDNSYNSPKTDQQILAHTQRTTQQKRTRDTWKLATLPINVYLFITLHFGSQGAASSFLGAHVPRTAKSLAGEWSYGMSRNLPWWLHVDFCITPSVSMILDKSFRGFSMWFDPLLGGSMVKRWSFLGRAFATALKSLRHWFHFLISTSYPKQNRNCHSSHLTKTQIHPPPSKISKVHHSFQWCW